MAVPGALPVASADALVLVAEDIADKRWPATLARSIMAGALITLLSYLLEACDSVAARIPVTFMVGIVLALGPFDHVVVSALHLLFGGFLSNAIGYGVILLITLTLTHTAQARSERRS